MLVNSLYRPLPSTLREALEQWQRLGPTRQAASYLVVDGDEQDRKHTLNAAQIATLAASA